MTMRLGRKPTYGWLSDEEEEVISEEAAMNEIQKLVDEVEDGSVKQSSVKSVRKGKANSKKSVRFAETCKNTPAVVPNVNNTAVPLSSVKLEEDDVPLVSANDNVQNNKKTEKSKTVVDKTVGKKATEVEKRTNSKNLGKTANKRAVTDGSEKSTMKLAKKGKNLSNVRIRMWGGKPTYCWDIAIKNSRVKKDNVQHFPKQIAIDCLASNQKEVNIRDCDLIQQFKCTVKTAYRNGAPSPSEKYMTKGWYAYVKTKGFKKGDTLTCQLARHGTFIYVTMKKK